MVVVHPGVHVAGENDAVTPAGRPYTAGLTGIGIPETGVSVMSSVVEVSVHVGGEHRIFYVAKFQRAVYVLHAFAKKARKTPEAAIELARVRYREALRIEGLKK